MLTFGTFRTYRGLIPFADSSLGDTRLSAGQTSIPFTLYPCYVEGLDQRTNLKRLRRPPFVSSLKLSTKH